MFSLKDGVNLGYVQDSMDASRSACLRFLLLALSLVVTAHCSRNENQQDGTQHTGGGFVAYSTPEQVNYALDKAIQLASEDRLNKNIFVQFWRTWGKDSKNVSIAKPAHLFPKVNAQDAGLDGDMSVFDSPFLKALKTNKITRLSSGNCLKSSSLIHNDASVSSFTVNADLCFSIGNLTRIPPSTLLRETLSLVLHEVTHLGGAEEAEAVAWQELFSAYFGARFGDLETDVVADITTDRLNEAKGTLSRAISIASQNPSDTKIYALMSKLVGQLSSLPFYADELALELKTGARKPELASVYTRSVVKLIQKITIHFEIKSDTLKVSGFTIPIDFTPEDKVIPTLNETVQDLATVEANFKAFLGGTAKERSVCTGFGVGNLNNPPNVMMPNRLPGKCPEDSKTQTNLY